MIRRSNGKEEDVQQTMRSAEAILMSVFEAAFGSAECSSTVGLAKSFRLRKLKTAFKSAPIRSTYA
jgi:hypothetical protein